MLLVGESCLSVHSCIKTEGREGEERRGREGRGGGERERKGGKRGEGRDRGERRTEREDYRIMVILHSCWFYTLTVVCLYTHCLQVVQTLNFLYL